MISTSAMPTYNNFFKWLFYQRDQDTSIGDLARDAFIDRKWDGTISGLKSRINDDQLNQLVDAETLHDVLDDSIKQYRRQRKRY